MNFRLITRGDDIITLEQAREHLKLVVVGDSPATHPEDDMVDRLRRAAQDACRVYLGRYLSQCVAELRIANFASVVRLPYPPVHSIAHVKYLDGDGAEQTLDTDSYTFIDDLNNPHIIFHDWPSVDDRSDAVRIRMSLGYTEPGSSPHATALPEDVNSAAYLLLSHWYENRGAVNVGNLVTSMPLSATWMLDQHRVELGV